MNGKELDGSPSGLGGPEERPSDVQHTPGSWLVCTHERGDYYANITSDLGVKVNGVGTIRTIALVLKYAPPSERAANARLIAAAPDLLEAAKSALEALCIHDAQDGYAGDLLRAAIAKAEGRPTSSPSAEGASTTTPLIKEG